MLNHLDIFQNVRMVFFHVRRLLCDCAKVLEAIAYELMPQAGQLP
jgi:hypothetical protein